MADTLNRFQQQSVNLSGTGDVNAEFIILLERDDDNEFPAMTTGGILWCAFLRLVLLN